jgi:hypothetical protein
LSHAEYHAWLFEVGTGWLGWTPDVTRNALMTDIEAALRGKIDFVRKTSPFGDGGDRPESRKPMPRISRAELRKKLTTFFRGKKKE